MFKKKLGKSPQR